MVNTNKNTSGANNNEEMSWTSLTASLLFASSGFAKWKIFLERKASAFKILKETSYIHAHAYLISNGSLENPFKNDAHFENLLN